MIGQTLDAAFGLAVYGRRAEREERMTGRLEGKKAVLTAAAHGIGRATALAFAREGAAVVATDIDDASLASLASEAPGIAVERLDVLDAAAIAALASRHADAAILFNCAGFVGHGTILDCREEDWDFTFDLNVRSMYRMARALLPGMLDRGHGAIVNIASVASSIRGLPNRFAYGASKAAVIGLTRAIAVDFVTRGIRCNAIAPGTVETPSLAGRIAAQGDAETVRAAFVARHPMGRLGRPEEIAALAVYLASDESGFMTGQTIAVDGGFTL
jgi:2-keto-3-deoxy-L-fuconate dehydrogenase